MNSGNHIVDQFEREQRLAEKATACCCGSNDTMYVTVCIGTEDWCSDDCGLKEIETPWWKKLWYKYTKRAPQPDPKCSLARQVEICERCERRIPQ